MNYTHFSLEERLELEALVKRGIKAVEIGYRLDKDPTSISRELKRNRIFQGRRFNNKNRATLCTRFRECEKEELCQRACIGYKCRSCKHIGCTKICGDFEKATCKKITRFPYVCNSCHDYRKCNLERFTYSSASAHTKAGEKASVSREGFDLTGAELANLEALISPLMKKGQSLGLIYSQHRDEIPCSLKSLYTYVNSGVFEVGRMHMVSAIRYKPRKKKKDKTQRIPKKCLEKRRYSDFLALDEDVRDTRWEMDTVIGRIGGACFFTFLHRLSRFMFCLPLKNKESAQTTAALDLIDSALSCSFKEVVPLILTDGGSEFFDVDNIERGGRTKLYFCESYSAWQKGALEKNHTFIRRILPKSTSFDNVSERDCAVLMSHINSVCRPVLGGACPIDMIVPIIGQDALDAFGIEKIDPDDVCLSPELLRENRF
jgi:IS30 family transposase